MHAYLATCVQLHLRHAHTSTRSSCTAHLVEAPPLAGPAPLAPGTAAPRPPLAAASHPPARQCRPTIPAQLRGAPQLSFQSLLMGGCREVLEAATQGAMAVNLLVCLPTTTSCLFPWTQHKTAATHGGISPWAPQMPTPAWHWAARVPLLPGSLPA